MTKTRIYLLSTLSGILLSLAWPANGVPFLLFFALIPLLFIEEEFYNHSVDNNKYRILFPTWFAFIIWNGLTTYWVMSSTIFGGIMAVLLNSSLLAFVFLAYHIVRRTIKHNNGQFILLFFWLGWEYFHLDWDLSWPWLNLGNAFANYPEVIQWYEYTGVFGGTLWVITINILLFRLIKLFNNKQQQTKKFIIQSSLTGLIIIVPIIFSLIKYNNYKEIKNPVNITVIQPNNDPYSEQYELPSAVILENILQLADSASNDNTDFIIAPESAIQEHSLFERKINNSNSIHQLKKYIK
ncbi:MAG: apolipoprotein N-acyltransferase, partial [Bacteroidota bacterium]|nr:apolipoprotein N-acyltransferase [Bacteroidota bacterium]